MDELKPISQECIPLLEALKEIYELIDQQNHSDATQNKTYQDQIREHIRVMRRVQNIASIVWEYVED